MPELVDAEQLREAGVVLLRGVFPVDVLTRLRSAAETYFDAIAHGDTPQGCRFTPFSYSLCIEALPEFRLPGVARLANDAMGEEVECWLSESWLRKRFAQQNAPRHYHPNRWHQDGGLGVAFGLDARTVPPMTRLLTCWVPLQDCGKECPGLEFVRRKLDGLLHYSELDDAGLRRRFADELFWTPEFELGDGAVFSAGTLHRTHVHPDMSGDRMSLEYRFFPLV